MCGQHNVRASAGDSTGQNTYKGHTPNPRTEIKIPDPPGIEPEPPGWKAGTLPTTPRRRIIIKNNSINMLLYILHCFVDLRIYNSSSL